MTTADNLCLSCSICNRYKGSDLCSLDPQTNEITALFHPRHDRWEDHFELEQDGNYRPLTSEVRVTIRILRINESDQVNERIRLIALGDTFD